MRAKWPFPTTAYLTGVPPGGLDVGAHNHVAPGLAAWKPPPSDASSNPRFAATVGSNASIHEPRRKGKERNVRGKAKKPSGIRGSEEFRLKALASRAKSASTSNLRAQRELEQAGVVFPEQPEATPPVAIACTEKRRKNPPWRLQRTHVLQGLPKRNQPTPRVFRSLTCSVNQTLCCRIRQLFTIFVETTYDASLMHGKQHLSA